MSLTDNGSVYTARNGGLADFERNLLALGTTLSRSRPYHPQTCGKIERSWQTLKKWLRARDPATDLADLNLLRSSTGTGTTTTGHTAPYPSAPPPPKPSPPPPRPAPPTARCR